MTREQHPAPFHNKSIGRDVTLEALLIFSAPFPREILSFGHALDVRGVAASLRRPVRQRGRLLAHRTAAAAAAAVSDAETGCPARDTSPEHLTGKEIFPRLQPPLIHPL